MARHKGPSEAFSAEPVTVQPSDVWWPSPPDWQQDALCREYDGLVEFFPSGGEAYKPALAVCARCTVRDDCLRYAIETHQRFGIWGGTTEHQRQQLARAMRTVDTWATCDDEEVAAVA